MFDIVGTSICDEEMFEPRHCFCKILLSDLGKRKKKKTFKSPIKKTYRLLRHQITLTNILMI